MEEKFCLKWIDFQENTIKTFSKLRKEEEFYDVTLVSDDQKQIMAHKLVLSSSSEYFKHILKSNKHSHPMLCMTGITSVDLENVLSYIYEGEVQIFQENIEKFLNIAQMLKIEGLLSSDTENDDKFEQKQSTETKPKLEPTKTLDKSYEIKEDFASKNAISLNDSSSLDEIEQKITENLKINENGDYTCNICGRVGAKGYLKNLKHHIETHLEGISFSCSICGKQFRSRNSLKNHKSLYHKSK